MNFSEAANEGVLWKKLLLKFCTIHRKVADLELY